MDGIGRSTTFPRTPVAMALSGSAWAAFLLPPQVTAWDGLMAPAWARELAGAQPYDLVRAAGASLGITDDYVLFGVLVAPAFALVGIPLLRTTGGRAVDVLAWLTLLGALVSVLSYGGYGLGEPWDALWGTEMMVLLLICLWGPVAGVLAYRRRRVPLWCSVVLVATPVVLVASTVLFTYFPHGTIVGFGAEVAALVAGMCTGRASSPASP